MKYNFKSSACFQRHPIRCRFTRLHFSGHHFFKKDWTFQMNEAWNMYRIDSPFFRISLLINNQHPITCLACTACPVTFKEAVGTHFECKQAVSAPVQPRSSASRAPSRRGAAIERPNQYVSHESSSLLGRTGPAAARVARAGASGGCPAA